MYLQVFRLTELTSLNSASNQLYRTCGGYIRIWAIRMENGMKAFAELLNYYLYFGT